MDVTHVMVGYSRACLTDLDAVLPPRSVVVLEEPEVIAARGVQQAPGQHRCVAALVAAPTQTEGDPAQLVAAVARPPGVRAVIPAVEYGVVGAAALAQAWKLPGAGLAAARAMRDKIRLRDTAAADGVIQPKYQQVSGPGEVAAFRDRHGGQCVLKPANLQASLGVRLLGPDDDVEAAWTATTAAHEPKLLAHRPAPRYLVEERVHGPEVSVETLVSDGVPGFTNMTAKLVQPGLSPVEFGHVVPADLTDSVRQQLDAAVRALVAATGYGHGVLHSEFILGPTGPCLVECAARIPGDSIDVLIDLAYGGSLLADYLAVLEGRRPAPPRRAQRAAAIRFLPAPAGTVTAVSGVEHAAVVNGVHEALVTAAPGQLLKPVASSWDRCGHVIATGADGAAAVRTAETACAMVTIAVQP